MNGEPSRSRSRLQKMMNSVRVIGLMCVVIVSMPAQERNTDAAARYRVAQSYERAGDWEHAVPIYESLLENDPRNYVYYDALQRGYVQLKDYDRAVGLIEQRLGIQPGNPALLSMLGGVYHQMGNEAKADSIWQETVRVNPGNPTLYRIVASQMMEFRLYDKAIALFLQARKATGDEGLFIDDLANLYSAFQQYADATREYVRLLRLQPQQLSGIQSRMSVFLYRPEARKLVRGILEEEVARQGDFVPLRQLYAWVLMEEDEYEAALDQYLILDPLLKARGVEVFNFAQRALAEGQSGTAAKAFQKILENNPPGDLIPVTRLGYAKAVEQLTIAKADSIRSDPSSASWPGTEAPSSMGRALQLYESVVKDYPGTSFAAESFFRIGLIKHEWMNDLDGALAALRGIPGIVGRTPLALESRMKAAEVLLAKNDLARARDEYRMLLLANEATIRDRVLFRLAELDYFTAAFDTAAAVLRQLSANTATDLANDALRLLYFIEENKGVSADALTEYSRAHLLLRQRRYSESLEGFRMIGSTYPTVPLVPDATLQVAEIQILMGKPRDALVTLASIVNAMPSSIIRDRAMMRTGEIHDRILRDPAKAIQAYEDLLAAYPSSIYTEEARKRIRLLRGDIL